MREMEIANSECTVQQDACVFHSTAEFIKK